MGPRARPMGPCLEQAGGTLSYFDLAGRVLISGQSKLSRHSGELACFDLSESWEVRARNQDFLITICNPLARILPIMAKTYPHHEIFLLFFHAVKLV
jgi:hypothetical protein